MNILWISYYPLDRDGHPSPWITSLANEISIKNHHLTILSVSSKISKIKEIDCKEGYQVIIVPYKGGLVHLLSLFNTRINALKNFLNNYNKKIDIIHIHGTEHQFTSSVLRSRNKTPFIVSVQGIISLYKNELKRKLSPVYFFWTLSSFFEKSEIRKSK